MAAPRDDPHSHPTANDDTGGKDPAPEGDASALWRAVIMQALRDLTDYRATVRADARDCFRGPRLRFLLEMAGCDPAIAPVLRAYAEQQVARYRVGGAAKGKHIRHVSHSRPTTASAHGDAGDKTTITRGDGTDQDERCG